MTRIKKTHQSTRMDHQTKKKTNSMLRPKHCTTETSKTRKMSPTVSWQTTRNMALASRIPNHRTKIANKQNRSYQEMALNLVPDQLLAEKLLEVNLVAKTLELDSMILTTKAMSSQRRNSKRHIRLKKDKKIL